MILGATTRWTLGLAVVATSLATAQTPEEPPQPESPRFARELGNDFKNLLSRENWLVLGIASASALAVSRFDRAIVKSSFSSERFEGTAGDGLLEAGEVLGGGVVHGGGALALYGFGKIVRNREIEELGGRLVRAQLVNFTLTHTLKVGVGRPRPDGASRNSFPSGHTSSAFATASVLHRRYGWKAGVPAFGLAGYVAASRLSEGRHYPSDVLFGAVVGLVSGRAVTVGEGSSRFAIQPVFVPGGGGVELTWLGREAAP